MKKIAIIGMKDAVENYQFAVASYGAVPVILDNEKKLKYLEDIDGVLLPGGVDINPALYHQRNTACEEVDDVLDSLEYKAAEQAIAESIPILGICRGFQFVNIMLGGTLIQDISARDVHTREKNSQEDKVHDSLVIKDTWIHDIYKKEKIHINSAHHQAVDVLGDNLVVSQYSEDGLVEAFYHKILPIYAVQWHPERMCLKHARKDTEDGGRIFEYFLSEIV